MKKTFLVSTFLITWVGMVIVFVLASTGHNHPISQTNNQKITNIGEVKAASIVESTITFTEISAADVLTLINKKDPNIVLIDVSPGYKTGHIPTAVSFPLKDIDKFLLGMDKNKSYIIYCRNNTDSLVAIQKLVNYGFQNISRLSGGYNNWVKSKYKIEK